MCVQFLNFFFQIVLNCYEIAKQGIGTNGHLLPLGDWLSIEQAHISHSETKTNLYSKYQTMNSYKWVKNCIPDSRRARDSLIEATLLIQTPREWGMRSSSSISIPTDDDPEIQWQIDECKSCQMCFSICNNYQTGEKCYVILYLWNQVFMMYTMV